MATDYNVLTKPLNKAQITEAMALHGEVSGVILVSLQTLIQLNHEGLMDYFEEELLGEGVLGDIEFVIVGREGNPGESNDHVHIKVSGVVD